MHNLITIHENSINNETIQTVNARDLHSFLEVKSKFIDWITRRIEEYDFQPEIDYILLTQKKVNGVERHEYFLSLDMAKEISMVERNEKGKEARLYFIQCEKYIKQPNFLEVKTKAAVILIESVTKTLKLTQSSTLCLYRSLQNQLGFSGLLPDYTVDASDENATSSDVHHSLSHLLKENNIEISARAVYVVLDSLNITKLNHRKRQNGSVKKFRTVTDLKYGINIVSDKNINETQPHFYDHLFLEMMRKVGLI